MKKTTLLICSLLIFAPGTSNSMKKINIFSMCLPRNQTPPLSNLKIIDNESSYTESTFSENEIEEIEEKDFREQKVVIVEKKETENFDKESTLKFLARVGVNTTIGAGTGWFFGKTFVGALQGLVQATYHSKDNKPNERTLGSLLTVWIGAYGPMSNYDETRELPPEDALKYAGLTATNLFIIPPLTDVICNKMFNGKMPKSVIEVDEKALTTI